MIHEEARVLISTEKLHKYCEKGSSGEAAVKCLDMRIMQGEFVIVHGISGKQKNAFFGMFGCLERPDSGKYYFDYEDIGLAKDEMLDDIRRNKIGYLFRDFRLIERLNVRQNIEVPMYGLDISVGEKSERVSKALNYLGLQGLEKEKVTELTDLQKQQAALARAIVNDPLVIIADEPSANLNIEGEGWLMEQLWRLNTEGTAILLVTAEDSIETEGAYRKLSFVNGSLSSDMEVYGQHGGNGGSV
ncbi:MAG: ATP-binding cassette domain-containing protein [Pseudomonadota bacterium]